MKYMLLMHHGNEGGGDCPPITTWAPEEVQAHIAFMIDLNKDLAANGELVAAEGLAWPNEAKVVVCKGGLGLKLAQPVRARRNGCGYLMTCGRGLAILPLTRKDRQTDRSTHAEHLGELGSVAVCDLQPPVWPVTLKREVHSCFSSFECAILHSDGGMVGQTLDDAGELLIQP